MQLTKNNKSYIKVKLVFVENTSKNKPKVQFKDCKLNT